MNPFCWLLVDDDPDLAFIVRLLLQRRGESLLHAGSVPEATEILRSSADRCVILLDVNLPGKSGLDWLREGGPPHPVAMFVQSHMTDELVSAWEAGASYWVPKESIIQKERWNERLNEIILFCDGQGYPVVINSSVHHSLERWWDVARSVLGASVEPKLIAAAFRRALVPEPGNLLTDWIVERLEGPSSRPSPPIVPAVGQAFLRQLAHLFGLKVAHRLLVALESSQSTR